MNVLNLENLKNILAQVNFFVPPQHEKDLLHWAQFWYKGKEHLPELAQEIAEKGKCGGCLMPVYVIEQEHEAGNMRLNHLLCSGCHKACDGGVYKRENDYYSFQSPRCGVYVFWKLNGENTEEWYCPSCKFELLCHDCGSPHELDTDLFGKPEGANFYLCESCAIRREAEQHQENHASEPNLDCSLCQQWAERWEVLRSSP